MGRQPCFLAPLTQRHHIGRNRCVHRRQGGHVFGVVGREQMRVDRQRRGDLGVAHEPGHMQRRDTGSVWAEPGKLHVLGGSHDAPPLPPGLAAQLRKLYPRRAYERPPRS